MALRRFQSVRDSRTGADSAVSWSGSRGACPSAFRTSQRWAWPPASAAKACGGSLGSLNLLDRLECDSDVTVPQTEAELAYYYQQQIMEAQQRHLEPLREDLADWLNKILELDHLTSSNFMDQLDTGVLICHLARIIQSKAREIVDSMSSSSTAQSSPQHSTSLKSVEEAVIPEVEQFRDLQALLRSANTNSSLLAAAKAVPQGRIRCWERAAKGSFFSRENACNFIQFCRQLGIHEHLLFESEDLVLHREPRNVILCLLEVGRVAGRLSMEPPGLVQLEHEVDLQIQRSLTYLKIDEDDARNGGQPDPLAANMAVPCINTTTTERQKSDVGQVHDFDDFQYQVQSLVSSLDCTVTDSQADEVSETSAPPDDEAADAAAAAGAPTDATEAESAVADTTASNIRIPGLHRGKNLSELDKKVEQFVLATRAECRCAEKYCERLNIYKISEGLYRIGDRNVFIRLFKDRHVMVRVGGGWDTLEHYLIRHDPCRKGGSDHSPSSHHSRSPTPDTAATTPVARNRLPMMNGNGSAHLKMGGSTPCLTQQVCQSLVRSESVVRNRPNVLFERQQSEPLGRRTKSKSVSDRPAVPMSPVSNGSVRHSRKNVSRSLTMDLNAPSYSSSRSINSSQQDLPDATNGCRRPSSSSITMKTKLSTITSFKESNMSVADLIPEPSKTAGFSFGRAPVGRNQSFNSGYTNKRSRGPPSYNRSITSDLSYLGTPTLRNKSRTTSTSSPRHTHMSTASLR